MSLNEHDLFAKLTCILENMQKGSETKSGQLITRFNVDN